MKRRLYLSEVYRLRKKVGCTQKVMSVLCGVNINNYNGVETGRISPVSVRTGYWSSSAINIACCFEVDPCVLWPEEFELVKESRTYRRLNDDGCSLIGQFSDESGNKSIEHKMIDDEAYHIMYRSFKKLDSELFNILSMYHGINHFRITKKQIGYYLGLKPEIVVARVHRSYLKLRQNSFERIEISSSRTRSKNQLLILNDVVELDECMYIVNDIYDSTFEFKGLKKDCPHNLWLITFDELRELMISKRIFRIDRWWNNR